MWYRLYPVTPTGRYTDERRGPRLTCYAESKDGIHWEKPDLGIVEWQGSRRNNILFPPGDIQGTNACVIIDPNAGVQARIFNLMFDIPTFQRLSASLFIGARAR